MTSYKFVKQVRSKKNTYDEVKEDGLVDYIQKNPVAYESLISGSYIPYYEFDYKYISDETRSEMHKADEKASYNSVVEVMRQFRKGVQVDLNNHTIYCFDASGYDPIKNKFKNSFHYRIRGVGYYESATDIPYAKGCDVSVYKRKNSRQLMRVPFCTKEGNNRPLLRFFPDDDRRYTLDDIKKKVIDENLKDYLIQNSEGEDLLPSKKDRHEIEVKLRKVHREKLKTQKLKDVQDKQLRNADNAGIKQMLDENEVLEIVSVQFINQLCKCLNKERFDDRRQWLRFIRCLKNVADNFQIEHQSVLALAHKYSSTSDKYNSKEVDTFFSQDHTFTSPKLSIGSLCYWANQDAPARYSEIKQKNEKVRISKYEKLIQQAVSCKSKYTFSDYIQFINRRFDDEYEIIKYLVDTIIHVIDGGGHKIFTRNVYEDKSIKFVISHATIFCRENGFKMIIQGMPVDIHEYFIKNFYHVKCYNYLDYVPYLSENPCSNKIFNLFQGFQYKYQKMNPEDNISDLDIILYHIKDIICDGDVIIYDYLMNYISHMFQKPAEKVGIAILLQSQEHGTGKNRLTDFLMNCCGIDNTYKANKMEDICSKFNFHMQGKLLVVGDEIANYTSHKFADMLKAIITETIKAIEPKGKDPYIIQSFERYMFTSNNDFPFRVDKGDRRLLPLMVNPKKKGDTEYFNKLSDAIESPKIQELFFNYMASRDIEGWNFRKIPETKLKAELIAESLGNPVHFMIQYLNEHHSKMQDVSMRSLFDNYKRYCEENNDKAHSYRKFNKDLKNTFKFTQHRFAHNVCSRRSRYYKIHKGVCEKIIQSETGDSSFKFDDYEEEQPIVGALTSAPLDNRPDNITPNIPPQVAALQIQTNELFSDSEEE